MRSYKCIVSGCKSDNMTKDADLFCLPQKSDLLEKWASNMLISELVKDKPASTLRHMRVCSLHFETACFQTPLRKKLNRGAIPAILLVTNEPEIRPSKVVELPHHSTLSKNFPAFSGPSTNLSLVQVIPGVLKVSSEVLPEPSRNQQLSLENPCTPPPAADLNVLKVSSEVLPGPANNQQLSFVRHHRLRI